MTGPRDGLRAIALAAVVAMSCGCDGGSPTAPPPPTTDPGAPPAPIGLTAELTVAVAGNTVTFSWIGGATATSFLVEIGRQPGSGDTAVIEVDRPTLTWEVPDRGINVDYFVRVRGQNDLGVGPRSSEVGFLSLDLRDYIEALFLGTGVLTPTDGNHGCSATGFLRGFSAGTTVRVIVSSTVSADKRDAIGRAVSQVAEATAGAIVATLEPTTDPDPIPGRDQVTSTTHPNPASQGCASDNGCTIHVFINPLLPGVYFSSRAVQPANQTSVAYAHDAVGHGVLGLCHPDGNLIGGAPMSMMSAGPGVVSGGPNGIADRLTALDVLASRIVYNAGLRAGARRGAFVGAGLIKP